MATTAEPANTMQPTDNEEDARSAKERTFGITEIHEAILTKLDMKTLLLAQRVSRDWQKLDSYWFARSSQPVPGGPISWSSEGPPPTPFLRTEGLVSARCVNAGPKGYLEVRVNADPRDKRTDRIGGEVGMAGFFLPGWGMHLADVSAAQGDLVRMVEEVAPGR